MTELLLPRGSTKYKEQVQKFLESQPAVKKDRAGELALGNSFLGLTGRGVISGLGMQGRLKNRVGGPGWNGPGETPQAKKRGRPGNSKNATLPARESFFCIFFVFFCFSQTRSHFLAFFLHFPDWELFFCISQTGNYFLYFLHFLDRICHLHRLPDPYEKTTRK